jgi:membrane fusion protein (multidrug efflux system)
MQRHALAMPLVLACSSLLLLSGCDDAGQAAAPNAPPEVSVVAVSPAPQRIQRELPGRVSAMRIADVRARVSGIVVERTFKQGSDVQAGDVLYRIDPQPFEVELKANEAALAKAKVAATQNKLQEERLSSLLQTKAVSLVQYETALANFRQSEAEVTAREADVARAKLNLDYATIRAPISGRIGRALVSEGALVTPTDNAHVATIHQIDPVYVDFTQSVAEVARLRRDFESGELERISPDAAKISIVLDDDRVYELPGKLLFSDAMVEPSTGRVTLRAELPNPHNELMPGMYVRVVIEDGIDSNAIAVPQQAVQRNPGGGSEVFVVTAENKAALRAVRTGAILNDQWLIQSGLEAGDKIVVEGFQKFAAGDAVTPMPWKPVAQKEADARGDRSGDAVFPVSSTR